MSDTLANQIARVPLDEIRIAPTNVKTHDRDVIVASLRRFGFADPIVVDQRTGELIAGHGRVEALTTMRDAGEDPPAGAEGWEVPTYVGWSSTDDTEADAARVALNRTTEIGGWDDAGLAELLARFGETDDGFVGVGYGEEDLNVLRRKLEALGEVPLDPWAAWNEAGMPEHGQEDLQSAASATIHFPTEEDAERFFKLIERPRKKSFWWPETDGHVGCDVNSEWVAAEDADDA